jgi:hypothetical protein
MAGQYVPTEEQYVSDILNYIDHGDPQVRGATAILCGTLIYSILSRSRFHVGDWLGTIRTRTGSDQFFSDDFSGYCSSIPSSMKMFITRSSG